MVSGVPSAGALVNLANYWERYDAAKARLLGQGVPEDEARFRASIAAGVENAEKRPEPSP